MRTKNVMGLLAVGGIIGLLGGAPTELLTNGGFESQPNFGQGVSGDSGYSALTGSQIPGWTIVAGHAVTVHNTNLYPTISGSYSVNMDGEGFNGVNADFSQQFDTSECKKYMLSFDWQGWFAGSSAHLDVSVVDTVTLLTVVEFNYLYSSELHHQTAVMIGTGHPFSLRVRENRATGFNDNAFIVDNFSVLPVLADPDLTDDGFVNGADIAIILGSWGTCGGDLNDDGETDGADIAIVLAWTG